MVSCWIIATRWWNLFCVCPCAVHLYSRGAIGVSDFKEKFWKWRYFMCCVECSLYDVVFQLYSIKLKWVGTAQLFSGCSSWDDRVEQQLFLFSCFSLCLTEEPGDALGNIFVFSLISQKTQFDIVQMVRVHLSSNSQDGAIISPSQK